MGTADGLNDGADAESGAGGCNHKQSLRNIPGNRAVVGIACELTGSAGVRLVL